MLNNLLSRWRGIPVQVKASVSYTVCNIIQKSLSFITLPLFTRLLTTEQYGQYSVYASWSSMLTIFITLCLYSGSFSKAMVKFEDARDRYVAAIQNITVILAVLFLAVYFPFRQHWNRLFELPTALVCLMVVEILGQFAISCWFGVKRFEFKYKSVIAMTLSTSVAMPVVALLLVLNSDQRGYARIFGYAAVTIITGLVLFIIGLAKGKGGMDMKYWRFALGFNIPLIPYYLSQVMFNQSARVLISHMVGMDEAGFFGLAQSLSLLLNFVLNAINDSYVPWFYGKIKEGKERENRSAATGIALLMAFLLMGIISLAPEIIMIMAGSDYMDAVWVVPPITMSVLLLFYSQLFINVEFYFEAKSPLVWGSIGAAVLSIVLNLLLIPVFGYVVAGYTTLISYVAFAVANYFTVKFVAKKNNFSMDAFDIKALILLFLCFFTLTMIAVALYNLPLIRYAIVAAVLLGVAVMHKRVIAFVTSVLKRK